MRNIQIVLNAILSKELFEYMVINREKRFVDFSPGVIKYIRPRPLLEGKMLEYLPEFIGAEEEIERVWQQRESSYTLRSIYKEGYYLDISLEYYDNDYLLILMHNTTKSMESEQKLLQYSNELALINATLKEILDKQNSLIFVVNQENIFYKNQQFLDYFDIKSATMEAIYRYVNPQFMSYQELFEHLQERDEYVVIGEDTFMLQATLIEQTHQLFILTKITKLSHELHIDALTGAYKRNYFNRVLERSIENSDPLVLVVMDIDNFKMINDTFGHQVGDIVLVEFSDLIQASLKEGDIFARWGGEEFLLLSSYTSRDKELERIESLRDRVSVHPFTKVEQMSASFGVSFLEQGDRAEEVIERADRALYRAKHTGKNRVMVE
jgi:diguanylate cyclase (GGDEF)-like protein